MSHGTGLRVCATCRLLARSAGALPSEACRHATSGGDRRAPAPHPGDIRCQTRTLAAPEAAATTGLRSERAAHRVRDRRIDGTRSAARSRTQPAHPAPFVREQANATAPARRTRDARELGRLPGYLRIAGRAVGAETR